MANSIDLLHRFWVIAPQNVGSLDAGAPVVFTSNLMIDCREYAYANLQLFGCVIYDAERRKFWLQ